MLDSRDDLRNGRADPSAPPRRSQARRAGRRRPRPARPARGPRGDRRAGLRRPVRRRPGSARCARGTSPRRRRCRRTPAPPPCWSPSRTASSRGSRCSRLAFRALDAAADTEFHLRDGERLAAGTKVAVVSASARALLVGERTALNFVQRASGVASLTRRFVDAAAKGGAAEIVDTRKTTPGLRVLDKYAVVQGGGANHASACSTTYVVKDNHLDLSGVPADDLEARTEFVARVRRDLGPKVRLHVEARTEEEARAAVAGGADVVLLDNFAPDALERLVTRLRTAKKGLGQAPLEGPPRGLGRRRPLDRRGVRAQRGGSHLRRRADALRPGARPVPQDRGAALKIPQQPTGPARRLALDLPAAHSAARQGRKVVHTFAKMDGLSDEETDNLVLVVAELLSNAVGGGRGGRRRVADLASDVRMRLEIELAEDRWVVTVKDEGEGDAGELAPLLADDDQPDLFGERGRGLFLLQHLVDELKIGPRRDGQGLVVRAERRVRHSNSTGER
ncbi:MAG: ATP-binding protein [Planctomycetota bacterium]